MKKLVTNYKLTQKIFLSIIIVLLLSFAVPVKSQAGLGGILLDPLFDLVGTVLDIVTGALQAFLVDGEFSNTEKGDSGGFLNAYLVDKDKFDASKYPEFAYHTGSGEAQVSISEDELDKSIFGNSNYAIPVMKYSPEKIFSGRVPALDINFVNPINWEQSKITGSYTTQTGVETNIVEDTYENGSAMNERSITRALHSTIASWYVSLRNLAVVALMLVLVYVGIRIVISSTASDKAKYKQMLMDWLVALCLLFCLHYIMTFTTTIVNEVTSAITGSAETNGNNIAVEVSDGTKFNTDLMGLIRFRMQAPTVGGKILYLILYLAMVIYTCMFTFYYLKRVLTIAFLTLISPLVAMTYPIDKMRDGKAQAFDMWLKEYVFNALLQPFHLIIYSIFVGSAIDLAVKNPLFAIVALAFITPAEKILRKFFGFEKASTASALGAVASAAGGAALMNQMRTLMAPKKGGGGASGNKGIRNKNRVEGDVPSLGESLGGRGSNETNELGGPSAQQRMLEAYDEGFGTDAYDPAEREAMAREISQQEGMHYSDDELRQIYRDTGYSEDEIAAMFSSSEGSTTSGRTNTPPEIPTDAEVPTSSSTSSSDLPASDSTSSGIHLKDSPFEWSENDTRGAGAYLGGIVGAGASFIGGKIANSGVGQGAMKFGRTVAGGAKKVSDMTVGKIPKPIRNTIKGAGNVALRTGMAAGKAALKAAPGAMIGMAAGIAGDELSDIPKYTLAGAALSSTIGSSSVAQAGSFIANSYREGSGGDTPEAIVARQQKEYVKSKEWDDVYQQEFKHQDGSKLSKAELKAKKEQGAFYDSRGIQGEDAIKAVKLEEKIKQEVGKDQEEFNAQDYTARIMKIAKPYSADKLRKDSEVQSLTSSIEKELLRSGLDQRTAAEQAKTAVKYVKQAKGIKDEK